MTNEENVPTVEQLGDAGVPMKEVLQGGTAGPREITVVLSADEVARLGGHEGLDGLTREVQDFVNKKISKA